MSWISYISFPRELIAFRFSDIKGREEEFGIFYDTTDFRPDILLFPDSSPNESNIVIVDKKDAIFNSCFKNSFVYESVSGVRLDYAYRKAKIIHGNLDDKTKDRELEKFMKEEWKMSRQIQYNFINKHINIGEFVERYSSWHDHINFNFDPPTSEEHMTLEEFLNMPMPTGEGRGIDERHKLIIHKTK